MSGLVRIREEGRVRVLVLDRPEARNALSAAMREDLVRELRAAEVEPGVGAVVLTGEGPCFAAGADLRELLSRSSAEQRRFLSPPHVYEVVESLAKPVLAAVNGHALGAGLELATACDLRVAAPRARLGQPEVRFALLPGGGGTQRLVRLVGHGQASRLVLTGEPVSAQEALAMGLVEEVHEDPVARAVGLAAQMARHDPEAVATARRALRAARMLPYSEGLDHEVEAFLYLHARQESRQRVQAFLEKAA